MSEFTGFIQRKRRDQAGLAASTSLIQTSPPDQFAQNRDIASELEIPAGVVATAPEVFAQQIRQKRDQKALVSADKIRGWLLEPDNGEIASDDVQNLTTFEEWTGPGGRAIGRGARRLSAVPPLLEAQRASEQFLDSAKTFDQIFDEIMPQAKRESLLRGGMARQVDDARNQAELRFINSRSSTPQEYVERGAEKLGQVREIMDRVASIPKSDIATAFEQETLANAPNTLLGTLGAFVRDPVRGAAFLAETGAESLPVLAAATATTIGTGQPVAGIGVMAGGSFLTENAASAAEYLAENNIDVSTPEAAALVLQDQGLMREMAERGMARGLVIAVFDAVSGGVAGKTLVQSPYGEVVAQGVAQAVFGSSGEAAAQFAAGQEYNARDIVIEGLAETVTAPVEVGGVAGRGIIRDFIAADKSGDSRDALDKLDRNVEQSKLKERAPDKFMQALERAGLAEQDLYVPAEDVREFFQSQNLDDEAVARWGVSPEVFAEKIASGGDIVIPVADYAANISGTDDAAWLKENAVLDPDEMSPAQAQRFNEAAAEAVEDAYREVIERGQSESALQASDAQVYDAMLSQLRVAGRSLSVAQNESRVWQAFWSSMAERLGGDPLEMAQQFGVRVEGPNRDVVGGRRRSDLDIMLNTLRKGPPKPKGSSLVKFLIDRGGLRDFGGDIQALDPPKRLIAATSKDLPDGQTSLGGSAPAPLLGEGLDVAARAAIDAGYFPELLGQIADNNDNIEGDIVGPLLEAISAELSGEARFVEGEGPDVDLVALARMLDEIGIDLDQSNDEIVAAIDAAEQAFESGREVFQSAPPVKSDAFKSWFGDSKVVDEKGNPLVVYHGSPDIRGVLKYGFQRSAGRGNAFFFSDDQRVAETYADDRRALNYQEAEPYTIATYLSLQNPAEIDAKGQHWRDTEGAIEGAMEDGHDGIIIRNTIDEYNALEGQGGIVSDVYVAFDPTQIKSAMEGRAISKVDGIDLGSAENDGAFNPDDPRILNQDKRGSIQFPRGGLAEGETVINLFESADLSTFLHESGHFFLEAFDELAKADAAPDDMRADMDAIRKFLGVAEGEQFTTEHHEKWARGFEAYVLEGKAPSLALADAFARFKSWLMRIYHSIRDLDVKLTPEIRSVMDRMLATEAEIAAMREDMALRPLFRAGAPDGMADADFATYQRMARRSVEQAEQRLLKKTMAKVKRERESWYKSERTAMRKDVESEVNSRREHRLVEMLANQKWIGSERDVPDMRIDRGQLVEMFGEGVLPEISRAKLGGKRAIYADTGESPQVVAQFFGFQSATEMIEALQNTPKRKESIEVETDRRMVERYGDPLNDGSIEEEALEAIHTEQQASTVASEARHLAQRTGRPAGNITAKTYRARAKRIINEMPVRDVLRPDVFLNAERKAARDAEKAFAQVARGSGKSGDALERAAVAKERQLLNHYLFSEAREAEKWISKGREKAREYESRKVRAKVGSGYIEQIDAILERFDFRVRSKSQVERSESLRDFVRRMVDEGRESELSIADKLLDESNRTHFTRLSVGELRGVFDTVENIDHMGRFKRKLIDQKRKRDLDDTVDGISAALRENVGERPPSRTAGKGERTRKTVRDYMNLTLNADTLLREVDGFETLGVAYSAIKQPVDEGMARLTERRLQMANDLDEIYNVYDGKTLRKMSQKRSVPSLDGEFTQWELIAIALNTGNEDNYQRLTNPKTKGGFTAEQVNGALAELTEQDWHTVQSMWDYINGFWPEIAQKEKRATGLVPTKVESKLMVDAPSFVKGGYYPIKYDSRLSGRATDLDAKSMTDSLMGGRFGKAQTANGHTKERAQNVTMPLKLDLAVAHSHLAQVLYDLEIGEAVTNSWRILQDDRIKSAFINSGKKSDHEALEIWLQDVAAGDRISARGMEVALRHLRSGFTISRLAINVSTALIQPTGLAQSAVVVGKRATAAGVIDYLKNPALWTGKVLQNSAFMRERQTTFERDIFNVVGDLEGGPVTGRWAKFQRDFILPMSFILMQKMQFYVVDMPTWVGAYNKEVKKSGDEERARLYADRMVARAQGSGLMSDRGMLERGTTDKTSRQRELPRMLTALGSYMFAKGNVAYEATMKTNFQDPVEAFKWAVDISLLFTFEAVLYSAVKGFGPDEDEELASWLLKETGFSMMSTVPLAREISGGLQGFGSGGILGSTLDKAFIKPITQAQQGEMDRAFVKSLVDMTGIWFHLPSSQTNTILNAVFDDDMEVKEEIDPLAVLGVGTGRGNTLADYFMSEE